MLGKRKPKESGLPPSKKIRTEGEESQKKRENEITLLEQLDLALSRYKKNLDSNQKVSFVCSEIQALDDFQTAKNVLEEYGFIILRDAISKASVSKAKVDLGAAIIDMWREALKDQPEIRQRLQKGDLDAFQRFRNSKNGQGNASFGYYYKQFLKDADYPTITLQGDRVYLDHNPIHFVNLQMISHEDNLHSLAILLSLTHIDGMISWDSVKYATNPRPKPKEMTKQQLTPMHIDHYSNVIGRYQAIDNVDGPVKLFFVPGTHTNEIQTLLSKIMGHDLFKEVGYKRIPNNERLQRILWKHAIAPPPYARVIWKSGMIHFEGNANTNRLQGAFEGCHPCVGIVDIPNALRFRFVIGTHLPTLTQDSLIRLGIAARRGLCPAIYSNINKTNCVHPNIVNRKNTQYKIPRPTTAQELEYLRSLAEGLSEEDCSGESLMDLLKKEIPSSVIRLLLGIHEPTENLKHFSPSDIEVINSFRTKNS